jgi:hypothetical protein
LARGQEGGQREEQWAAVGNAGLARCPPNTAPCPQRPR